MKAENITIEGDRIIIEDVHVPGNSLRVQDAFDEVLLTINLDGTPGRFGQIGLTYAQARVLRKELKRIERGF